MLNAVSLKTKGWVIFAVLFFLMLATRADHFGSAISLPDASLAIFFLAGFYLRRLWVFVLFCVLAVGIDYWAINVRGVSSFCVTPAYGFLLPAYFTVWWAGRWSSSIDFSQRNGWLQLITAIGFSVSVAFLISNGSFYWLSGRYVDLNLADYFQAVVRYYPRYLITPLGYLCAAALFHYLLVGRKAYQVGRP